MLVDELCDGYSLLTDMACLFSILSPPFPQTRTHIELERLDPPVEIHTQRRRVHLDAVFALPHGVRQGVVEGGQRNAVVSVVVGQVALLLSV